MIGKIAIIPYVTNGRNSQVGHDGYLNIFKKKKSTVLKEKLERALSLENIDTKVIVDVNHGDLPALKREGVDLFLIPEDIASYIDYGNINKTDCYRLGHEEYEKGDVRKIIEYIKVK